MLYGDTGVRAFYDDANELGKVIGLANASSTVKDSAVAISTILTQFAGQLAVGRVEQANHAEALAGVLTLAVDKKTLSVNLSDALWTLGRESSPQTNIVGREDLITGVGGLATHSNDGLKSDIESGMKWLWASDQTNIFDKVTFATTNDNLTATLSADDLLKELRSLFNLICGIISPTRRPAMKDVLPKLFSRAKISSTKRNNLLRAG